MDCHNEAITPSLQGAIEDTICDPLFIGFMISDSLCNKTASMCIQY